MKLSKKALRQIRQFARENIGGFGMWLELAEKWNRANDKQDHFVNLLQNPTPETTDLSDFCNWNSVKKMDIPLVNGFALLDFHVHDKEELKDYVDALIDDNGNVVKLWLTYANKEELKQLLSK